MLLDFKYLLYPTMSYLLLFALISSVLRPDYNVFLLPVLAMALKQARKENLERIAWVLTISSIIDVAWLAVQGSNSSGPGPQWLSDTSYAFSAINVIGKMFLVMFVIIAFRNWRDDSVTYFSKLNSEPVELDEPVLESGH